MATNIITTNKSLIIFLVLAVGCGLLVANEVNYGKGFDILNEMLVYGVPNANPEENLQFIRQGKNASNNSDALEASVVLLTLSNTTMCNDRALEALVTFHNNTKIWLTKPLRRIDKLGRQFALELVSQCNSFYDSKTTQAIAKWLKEADTRFLINVNHLSENRNEYNDYYHRYDTKRKETLSSQLKDMLITVGSGDLGYQMRVELTGDEDVGYDYIFDTLVKVPCKLYWDNVSFLYNMAEVIQSKYAASDFISKRSSEYSLGKKRLDFCQKILTGAIVAREPRRRK